MTLQIIRNPQNTMYCIDSATGVPMFGCEHKWGQSSWKMAGRLVLRRTCDTCGRYEKWLEKA